MDGILPEHVISFFNVQKNGDEVLISEKGLLDGTLQANQAVNGGVESLESTLIWFNIVMLLQNEGQPG